MSSPPPRPARRPQEVVRQRLLPAPVGQRLLRDARRCSAVSVARRVARGASLTQASRSCSAASSGGITLRFTPVPSSRPASWARRGSRSIRQQKCSAPGGAVRTHMFSGGRPPSSRSQPPSTSCSSAAPSGPSSSNRARGRAGTICSSNGTREANGQIATASESIATTRSLQPHLLLQQVGQQVAPLGPQRIGGEALPLAGDRGRHERQRVELGVRVGQRRSGLPRPRSRSRARRRASACVAHALAPHAHRRLHLSGVELSAAT